MEDSGPKSPALPPSLKGAPYGPKEVTAENWLAATEATRDRQDKISGANTALTGIGVETGVRGSSGENLQQQRPWGTGGPSGMDSNRQGAGYNPASRVRTALAGEALASRTGKKCKGEPLKGAEERLKIDDHRQLMGVESKANPPESRHKPAMGISDQPKTSGGGTLDLRYKQV